VKYYLRKSLRLLSHPKAWQIRLSLWTGALLIGAVAVLLIKGSELFDQLFVEFAGQFPYAPLLITPIGFICVVWCIHRYFPGGQGGGVPQTIASLQHPKPNHLISLRILLGKIAMVFVALACGASMGIGGPMVHIGASIMYVTSQFTKYTPRDTQHTAIMAGGAAAIATIFSAPLAGMAFAMEEISRSFQPKRSGLIIISVLLGMLVVASSIGYSPYFGQLNYQHPENASIWTAALICGIAGGLLGGIFSQGIITLISRTMIFVAKHPYRFAGICGFVVASIGILSSTPIYGTGFLIASEIAQNPEAFNDPWFPFLKILATGASFISGVPSGIFGPTIAIGASLGADLGQWVSFIPVQTAVLLAMAAYFSAVFQTPITAAILVLEISGSMDIMLPILAASYIGFAISRLICPKPLYRVLSGYFIGIAGHNEQKNA